MILESPYNLNLLLRLKPHFPIIPHCNSSVSPDKPFRRLVSFLGDDVDEVVGEDERHSLPLHAKLALEVTEEVAKVDVHELLGMKSHDSPP